MILGIVSDTHLGHPRFYDDSFRQFDEAFRGACDSSDIVVLPGDIFDTKLPKFEVIAKAMHCFEYGKKKRWQVNSDTGEGPVVAIHGTHDRRSKEAINPVQLLEKSGFITNLHDRTIVFEKDGERVAITGFGGVPEEFAESAMEAFNPKPVPGAYNVLVFHQTVLDVIPIATSGLNLKKMPQGFDLYLCGHIHKRITLKKDGKFLLIPGSTVLTQLKREETEKKAYVLFDTKTGEPKFVEINSRPFFFQELQLTDADYSMVASGCKKFIGSVLEKGLDMPIIKIQIKGNVKPGLKGENIDLSPIYEEYENQAYLEIDNALSSEDLKEKMEMFRKLYEEKKSVREIGIEILKKRLADAGQDTAGIDRLFETLGDSKNIDRYLEEIVKRNGKH